MAADDPLIGRQLASFRLERVLGRGGMATVYYGWDVKLDRPVAVKVIDNRHAGEAAYAERFVNEARAIATWNHPHILQVYYADDDHGLYYYVMEYVRGQDLSVVLAQLRQAGKLLPLPEVLRIGRAVAAAMDYAHARGVIHRDVKPANIMVADDSRVVLTDFGLALNVAQGTMGAVFGSPHYFAPEQARNSAEVVPQSDVYSLGVVMYEMLAGQVPFDDPAPLALAMLHIQQPPPSLRQFNPAIDPALEAAVLKALSKDPAARYQTAQAFVDALAQTSSGPEPTLAFLPPAAPVGERKTQPPPAPLPPALPPAGIAPAAIAPAGPPREPLLERFRRHPTVIYLARDAVAVWALLRQRPLTAAVARQLGRHPAAWLAAASLVLVGLIAVGSLANAAAERSERSIAGGATPNGAAATQPAADAPAATTAAADPPAAGAGEPFAAYYDDRSFYFHNLSANDRPVNPLAFERLTADGQPVNRFDGWRWGEIYGTFRAGYCVVVELIDHSAHLAPPECHNRKIVQRTPFSYDPFIFWTTQEGSTQFRVLWNDAEVGRCEIAAHRCDVNLP